MRILLNPQLFVVLLVLDSMRQDSQTSVPDRISVTAAAL
jgi:hypothetical protein